MNRLAFGNTSLLFLISAVLCLTVADIAITALNPWAEILRLARGIVRPDFLSVEAWSIVWTVAFAVVGVGIGASAGFLLAIAFPHFAAVRVSAMVLRSIHELFWALLLIQVRIPAKATTRSDAWRPPIPIDGDRCGAGA